MQWVRTGGAETHLDGKVVMITGAGGGFGRALARQTAARGASVVALDVHGGAAECHSPGRDRRQRHAIGLAVDVAGPR